MNVVSKSEASRIAGVTRQAINELSKINSLDKKKYKFFMHSPESGKHGVDIDHKEWKAYIDRNKHRKVKGSRSSNQTKGKSIVNVDDDYVSKTKFAQAVVSVIKKIYKPTSKELSYLAKEINKEYYEFI